MYLAYYVVRRIDRCCRIPEELSSYYVDLRLQTSLLAAKCRVRDQAPWRRPGGVSSRGESSTSEWYYVSRRFVHQCRSTPEAGSLDVDEGRGRFTPRKPVDRLDGAQECSSAGRAAVSKTAGRGFESLHSCQNHLPRWWNWQTRRLEGAVPARAYEFESHPRHQQSHAQRPAQRGASLVRRASRVAPLESAAPNRDNRSPGPRSQVVRQGSAKPLSSVRFRPWPPTSQHTPRDAER